MMHEEIDEQEIIERYVRNQLTAKERQAFEEHFFACQECFEKLQATERFVAGIRDASGRGLLDDRRSVDYVRVPSSWRVWMLPTLAATSCAFVVLVAITGWTLLFQMPKLRRQLNQASADANSQRQATATAEKQVASLTRAEPNVPMVVLQATREVQGPVTEAELPTGAARLVLWVDVPAGKFRDFSLQVETADHKPVVTLDRLQRNSYGALTAILPGDQLQPGDFRIMLTAEEPPPASLLAEYKLRIRRP